jgi:hypothetical protein
MWDSQCFCEWSSPSCHMHAEFLVALVGGWRREFLIQDVDVECGVAI